MTDKEEVYLMIFNQWAIEIRKFMRVNKIKVKEGKRNTKNSSRIAHFVSESFFNASKKIKSKSKGFKIINVMKFVNKVEPQIFTFAKKYSLACDELPSEKPLAYRQPTRKLMPWSDRGFVIVELENRIEEFLKEVFKV